MHAGVKLYATDLTITSVRWRGVNVKGKGSSVKVMQSNLNEFCIPCTRLYHMRVLGVRVQSNISTELVEFSISCEKINCNVFVSSNAAANLKK